jgi:hypothetical protein
MEVIFGTYAAIPKPPGSVNVPPWNVVAEPVVTVTFTEPMGAVGLITRLTVAVCVEVLGVVGVTETGVAVTPGPKLNTGSSLFPVGSTRFVPVTVTVSVSPG